MGLEGNNHNGEDICGTDGVPYFSDGNLDIPEGVRFHAIGIHAEASEAQVALKSNIIENFIRSSIKISSGDDILDSYVYNEIFSELLMGITESRGTLEDIDFPDYALRNIFTQALKLYQTELPEAFLLYSQKEEQIVLFGGRKVDIHLLVDSLLPEITLLLGETEDIQQNNNISPEEALEGFQQQIYTRDQVIEILEGEKGFQEDKNNGFSLSNALELFGFGQRLQQDIDVIFGRELTQEEIGNLINMMRYFLYVESSEGYNVSNYEGVSTAKGYFQYLAGDGKYLLQARENGKWVTQGDWNNEYVQNENTRKFWGTSSYETALGYIPESIVASRGVFESEISNMRNPDVQDTRDLLAASQDPRSLSSDEQIILFLSDLLKRPGALSFISPMLHGNIEATESLYILHHTAPDKPTEFRMLLAARDVYGIEIETYTRSQNGVVGLVLPEVNITNFFTELIREINPNTSLTRTEIMQELGALGNIPFQAGARIEIIRSGDEGVAYILKLNGNDYIQVNADKSFEYLG